MTPSPSRQPAVGSVTGIVNKTALEVGRYVDSDRGVSSRAKYGFAVFHLPRVKSGHATGWLPWAIDCSDNGKMQLITTESYTSSGVGAFSRTAW